jgi:hypothetical protein
MQALLSFEKLLTVVHHTSIQNEEYISIHAEILLIKKLCRPEREFLQ